MVVAPVLIAIVIGLAAGALRRGRIASLFRARLRRPVLLAVAVGGALIADLMTVPAPAVWAAVALTAGLAFAGSNLLIPGMAVIGIGIATNLVPVALNGAMPVRADALVDAEIVAVDDLDRVELRGARELADDATTVEILGDVIPVPWFRQVMSFGDLVVLVGLADVVANMMRRRRPTRLPHGAEPMLAAMGWDLPPDDDVFIDLRGAIDRLPGVAPGEGRPLDPVPAGSVPASAAVPDADPAPGDAPSPTLPSDRPAVSTPGRPLTSARPRPRPAPAAPGDAPSPTLPSDRPAVSTPDQAPITTEPASSPAGDARSTAHTSPEAPAMTVATTMVTSPPGW